MTQGRHSYTNLGKVNLFVPKSDERNFCCCCFNSQRLQQQKQQLRKMKEKQKHNDTTAAARLKWSQINTMTYFCLRERVNNSIYVSSIHLPTCLTSETINRIELIKKKCFVNSAAAKHWFRRHLLWGTWGLDGYFLNVISPIQIIASWNQRN